MQPSNRTRQIFAKLHVYASSAIQQGELTYALGEPKPGQRHLVILAPPTSRLLESFAGESSTSDGQTVLVGPLESRNATALRGQLSWLNPITLGLGTSAGF